MLKPKQVIIMNNTSIHKSRRVRELIEKAGYYLVYLLPYSPDLNPIENYLVVMKTYIRKIRHKFDNIMDAIDEALIIGKKYFLRKDITIS